MIITAVRPARIRVVRRLPLLTSPALSNHPLAQLVRFAGVGGASNLLYLAAFVMLRDSGAQLANIVGVVASTMLANELHRRVTFRASDRVDWFTAQWEGGGLAAVGLIASSAALALYQFEFPGSGAVTLACVVIATSAVVGAVRFVALRGWVFQRA